MKKKYQVVCVSEADYLSACDSYMGWCRACGDLTTDCVEPDATHYRCEACDERQVFGAENALLGGLIELE